MILYEFIIWVFFSPLFEHGKTFSFPMNTIIYILRRRPLLYLLLWWRTTRTGTNVGWVYMNVALMSRQNLMEWLFCVTHRVACSTVEEQGLPSDLCWTCNLEQDLSTKTYNFTFILSPLNQFLVAYTFNYGFIIYFYNR